MLTALRRWVRRHFGFSRAETNGFAALLLLLLGLFAAPVLLRPALPRYDPAADRARLEQVAAQLAAQRPRSTPGADRRYPSRYASKNVPQVPLAPFDPNVLDEAGWQARGLPRFIAERLVKYRAAVGGFKDKEQIRKAYGLRPEQYARLAPYMQLPEKAAGAPRMYTRAFQRDSANRRFKSYATTFPRKPRNLAPFDLNAADTTQLMQIRGVGRRLAARVVEYRERLGGFIQVGQVAEIYSLRDAPDLVDSLRKYTFVASSFQPAPINLNAEFEELSQHPYVGKRLGRVLVAYRKQHGNYRQAIELRQIRVLDDATYQKLLPYLRF